MDDGSQVDGLLQHEHQALSAPQVGGDNSDLPHDRIFQSSRLVASLFGEEPQSRLLAYRRLITRLKNIQKLRWRSYTRRPISLGRFDAELFSDFIWSQLFEKTLPASAIGSVTKAHYRILEQPRNIFHLVGLRGITRFNRPRYPLLDTSDYDFLLAQTPFPAQVSTGTTLIIRYHDAVPIFLPHTIHAKKLHQVAHYHELQQNVAAGAVFACSSAATREDLLSVFPELEARSTVIHNIVSDEYRIEEVSKRQAQQIILNRASEPVGSAAIGADDLPDDFLLMVSTLEPRKNHARAIAAWEQLRAQGRSDLALVLVGAKGWDYEPIEDLMRPWVQRRQLFHLTNVPTSELRLLYRHAAATICPGVAEGFDYTGIEAMRCDGLVVASDIPVHREVFGDGAAYFNPYCTEALAQTCARLLCTDGQDERKALQQAASNIPKRYTYDAIMPLWHDFFTRFSRRYR